MMMKRRGFQLAVLAAAVGLWAGCGGDDDPAPSLMSVDASGSSSIDAQILAAQLATYAIEPLSAAEAASLAYMREEEQLAHDVYAESVKHYPQQSIFVNIADSEATHSAAIKTLLDRYQLSDPLQGLPPGSFKTPAFQALYDALVAQSGLGLVQALEVGVEIEELDIYDLEAQKAVVDNADILMVYEHLMRASRNHLRAFWKVLTQKGGSYVPQYLSQAEFDAIVNSPIETGP